MNKLTIARTIGYSIATIAAASSYGHQVHLLLRADIGSLLGFVSYAYLIPATVDGLAIIALMVRSDSAATPSAKRAALLPLTLAGALSVAANVAEATNLVQIAVGVWTVLAYLLAESFVARIGHKAASATEAAPADSAAVVATPPQVPTRTAIVTAPVLAPAIAAAAKRPTTVTAKVTQTAPAATLINPRTGQPYSQRHARRLATGK